MVVFSDRHRRAYARNGFVVVDDAVDTELIAEARGAIKGDERIALDDNQNEPAGTREVFRSINEQLFDSADTLVGGDQLKHPRNENFGTYSDIVVVSRVRPHAKRCARRRRDR